LTYTNTAYQHAVTCVLKNGSLALKTVCVFFLYPSSRATVECDSNLMYTHSSDMNVHFYVARVQTCMHAKQVCECPCVQKCT